MHKRKKDSLPEVKFIVDDSHYFIPLTLVKAFSSTIRSKSQDDQFITYQFENLKDPQGLFNLIVNLFYGNEIDINENNAFFLGYVGDVLGITALSEATNSYRQIQLNTDNIFDILSYLGSFHITDPRIIKYAADNWSLLSKSEKSIQLPFFILNEIFSSDPKISVDFDFVSKAIEANLTLGDYLEKSEDDFYGCFCRSEYVLLFKYCDFEKMSSSQLSELLEYASFDSIRPQILEKFVLRMEREGGRKKASSVEAANGPGRREHEEAPRAENGGTRVQDEKLLNSEKIADFPPNCEKPQSSSRKQKKKRWQAQANAAADFAPRVEQRNQEMQNKQAQASSAKAADFQPKVEQARSAQEKKQQAASNSAKAADFSPKVEQARSSQKQNCNQTASNSAKAADFSPKVEQARSSQKQNCNQTASSSAKSADFSPKVDQTQNNLTKQNSQSYQQNRAASSSAKAADFSPKVDQTQNRQNRQNRHPQPSFHPNLQSSTQKVDSSNPTKTAKQPLQPPPSSPSQNDITLPSTGVNGCRRLQPKPTLPTRNNFVEVTYEFGFELSGVVWLLQESRLRLEEEVTVIVPKNTKSDLRYVLFDHNKNSWWSNFDGKKCNLEDAWIVVGFPNYTLRLRYYTIATKAKDIFYSQPMSWKVYGSDNPDCFLEEDLVSYVKYAPAMNIPKAMKTFEVEKKAKPYSYFKFVMLKNFTKLKENEGELSLSGFELFGIFTAK